MANKKLTDTPTHAGSMAGAYLYAAIPNGDGTFNTRKVSIDDLATDTELAAAIAAGVLFASVAEIRAGDVAGKAIDPDKLFQAMDEVNVAYTATVTLDFGAGINFKLDALTGPVTFANPTNAEDGMTGLIVVPQDATGSRVASYGNAWRFAGGSALGGVLSTPANSVDVISYAVINGLVYASIGKAFAA